MSIFNCPTPRQFLVMEPRYTHRDHDMKMPGQAGHFRILRHKLHVIPRSRSAAVLRRASKDGRKRPALRPSFETPRESAAPQDDG